MTYNKKTAQYGDAVFNTGDVMRMGLVARAFMDCIIVGFGELNAGTSAATGTLYAQLARPYCFISQGSVLTGIEYIDMVSLSSLAINYKRMDTGRTI
jgi:hypothetical protein